MYTQSAYLKLELLPSFRKKDEPLSEVLTLHKIKFKLKGEIAEQSVASRSGDCKL